MPESKKKTQRMVDELDKKIQNTKSKNKKEELLKIIEQSDDETEVFKRLGSKRREKMEKEKEKEE